MEGSRRGGAISSDKDALFVLWFYSINLQYPGINVCGDNQGRADAEKVDKADIVDGADGAEADGADGADEVDGIDGVDKSKVDRADEANGGRADRDGADAEEPDGADGGGADAEEPDGADRADGGGADGGGADVEGPDGVDGADGGGADVEESDRPGTTAGDLGLEDLRAEGRRVATQAATRLSLFSFCNIFFLFFSSSKSETCGSSFSSSPMSLVGSSVKQEAPSSKYSNAEI